MLRLNGDQCQKRNKEEEKIRLLAIMVEFAKVSVTYNHIYQFENIV